MSGQRSEIARPSDLATTERAPVVRTRRRPHNERMIDPLEELDDLPAPSRRRQGRRKHRDRRPVPREVIRVALTNIAHRGYALGRYEGRVVLVAYGIPGEEVMVEITERREQYLIGRVVEVLEPAATRVTPPCVYYGRCGGCQWQHIEYGEQLRLKQEIVKEQMRRIGHLPDDRVLRTVGAADPWHYRNHVRFTVWWGALGFVGQPNYRFVRIDECLIAHPRVNAIAHELQGHVPGAKQVMVRVGANTGDVLIQPSLERYEDVTLESGQRTFHESLQGEDFRVAASSFFQVNTPQAEVMHRLVREGLELRPDDVLLDAYAGVGTFAKALAPDVREVIAIEESASAVADAQENLAGLPNVTMVEGSVEKVLPDLEHRATAVILDPPRQGCHRAVIHAVIEAKPERLAYVSCDPATLARDLALLVAGGFELRSVQPLDMFPYTYHIECVALLQAR